MLGMGRVFQGAATVASILQDDLIERAAEAGLGSLFVGFETFSQENLQQSNKRHNLKQDYEMAVKRLHDLGIMINGSFVFGLDSDTPDVFQRTVDWGVRNGLATATYHILTPYPGTRLFAKMEQAGRILTKDWELYDTRHVVYAPNRMTAKEIEDGYWRAYHEFYSWRNILNASWSHDRISAKIQHLCYTGGWKKIEPLWNLLINLGRLDKMMPVLEKLLTENDRQD